MKKSYLAAASLLALSAIMAVGCKKEKTPTSESSLVSSQVSVSENVSTNSASSSKVEYSSIVSSIEEQSTISNATSEKQSETPEISSEKPSEASVVSSSQEQIKEYNYDYSWDMDAKTCKVIITNKADETDKDEETVCITYIKTKDATCFSYEEGHYEAEFTKAPKGESEVVYGTTYLEHSFNYKGECTNEGCTHSVASTLDNEFDRVYPSKVDTYYVTTTVKTPGNYLISYGGAGLKYVQVYDDNGNALLEKTASGEDFAITEANTTIHIVVTTTMGTGYFSLYHTGHTYTYKGECTICNSYIYNYEVAEGAYKNVLTYSNYFFFHTTIASDGSYVFNYKGTAPKEVTIYDAEGNVLATGLDATFDVKAGDVIYVKVIKGDDTTEVGINHPTHNYTTTYEWNEDYTQCRKLTVCSHGETAEDVTVTNITYVKTKDATCNSYEEGHYEATFAEDNVVSSDTIYGTTYAAHSYNYKGECTNDGCTHSVASTLDNEFDRVYPSKVDTHYVTTTVKTPGNYLISYGGAGLKYVQVYDDNGNALLEKTASGEVFEITEANTTIHIVVTTTMGTGYFSLYHTGHTYTYKGECTVCNSYLYNYNVAEGEYENVLTYSNYFFFHTTITADGTYGINYNGTAPKEVTFYDAEGNVLATGLDVTFDAKAGDVIYVKVIKGDDTTEVGIFKKS